MSETRATALLLLAIVAAVAGCETPPASIPPGPATPVGPSRAERPEPVRPRVAVEEVAAEADAGAGSQQSPAAGPESGPASSSALIRDGGACERAIQCASGICEGEGCSPDRQGVCMSRNRRCTRDLRVYCGCDGKTFQASGSCPGRRFASRAACQ
jgi:hypothetical protein